MINDISKEKEKRAMQIYLECNDGRMRNPSKMDTFVFQQFMRGEITERDMRDIFEKTALFNNVMRK